jgi:hypothetical protein
MPRSSYSRWSDFSGRICSRERIKDDEEYEDVRVHVTALLGQARITVQIDIAFGDRVVP